MKTYCHRPRTGFTLIEMMTVIFIIIILAGLGVSGMSYVTQTQNKKKAQLDIALLSKAIQDYHTDNGVYPGSGNDDADIGNADLEDSTEALYKKLFYDGYVAQEANDPEALIYLPDLDPRNTQQTLVAKSTDGTVKAEMLQIVDPWKRPYFYRKGNDAQNPDFDLWTRGKDGQTNLNNPDRKLSVNADDIRNF